jgi:dipeptidyl aminopeptidase/acylaminoacyl peptidase
VFWVEGGLVAQPFDLKTLRLTDHPIPLADQVHAFSLTGFAAFSVAPNLLVYQAGPFAGRLVWLDRQGLEVGSVGPPADYGAPRLSPDESSIASTARDTRLGTNDIFVHEFIHEPGRALTRRLTADRGSENSPVWSPDGKTIVYAADRHGPPNLHARSADGTGEERELVPPALGGPQGPGSFTRDGRSLVFIQPNPGANYDIMIAPLDGTSPPVAIVSGKGRDVSPRVSPDGQWLAYVSTGAGASEVYVQSLRDGHGRRQVSRDGGGEPLWRGDGKELYYITGPAGDRMMAVSMVPTGDVLEPSAPRLLFVARAGVSGYDVTKDGQRFLVVSPDLVAERGTLSAVANWTRLLKL